MDVYIHVPVCVDVHVYIHVLVCVDVHVYMHVLVCVDMHVHMHVLVCVNMHVYTWRWAREKLRSGVFSDRSLPHTLRQGLYFESRAFWSS